MALSLKLIRDTIQKDAAQNNMSPGQQAMMNAAKLATPPGAQTPMMPIQQNLDAAVSEEQQQMEAEKLEQERRKELDKKDQEISTMRSDLEMVKLELEREKIRAEQKEREMQMKADIQKSELAAADKLKKEQRELERRQNQFEIAEAKHQAQLEKATAQEQAKIEQSKSQALIDIAQTNADRYVKTTEEVKRNTDAYFDEQRKSLDEARSGLSPALRSQLTSAITALKGIGKVRAKSDPVMQKLATTTPAAPAAPITATTSKPSDYYRFFNNHSKFLDKMYSSSAMDLAKMKAGTTNQISKLQGERTAANDDWTEKQVNMYADRKAMLDSTLQTSEKALDKKIAKGDKDAWLEKFQLDNARKGRHVDRSGLFTGLHQWFSPSTAPALRSDLDMIENAYADNKAYEARTAWAPEWFLPIAKWADSTQNSVTDVFNDWAQSSLNSGYVKDMYNRAGVVQDWWGDGSAAPDWKINAVTNELDGRGLSHSALGNLANVIGRSALAVATPYSLIKAPVATAIGAGMAGSIDDTKDPGYYVPEMFKDDYTYDRYTPADKWNTLTKQSKFNPQALNRNLSGTTMGYNPNRPWWAGVLDMASPFISSMTGGLINFTNNNTPKMYATSKPLNVDKIINKATSNAFAHRTPRTDGYVNDATKLFNMQYNHSQGTPTRYSLVNNPFTAL